MNPVDGTSLGRDFNLFILGIFAFRSLPEIPARRSTRRPGDPNGSAQVRRIQKRNDTASDCDQTNKALLSSNDSGQMSLPPALLNLVDQAKDALWALTACIFHPSAKVKINGRTCAYPFRIFCASVDTVRPAFLHLL